MIERDRTFGRQHNAVQQAQAPGCNGKDGDGADEHGHAHAAGADGGDFAVGSQTAQSDEDADEHAHGQRDGEGRRQGIEKDFGNTGQWRAVADDELQQPSQVAHKDNEGEQRHAQQGVRGDFLQDVTGQDAHNPLSLPEVRAGNTSGMHDSESLDRPGVLCDFAIDSKQSYAFDRRLGYQQAVKRVFVDRRQALDGNYVIADDRQFGVAIVQ